MDTEITQKSKRDKKFLRLERIKRRTALKSRIKIEGFKTAKLEREIIKKRNKEEKERKLKQ